MDQANIREKNLFMVKVSNNAERYEDMVAFMKNVVKCNVPLIEEERDLLSKAYKNAIGAYRVAWRSCVSSESEEEIKGKLEFIGIIREYKHDIETNLLRFCDEIIELLNDYLLPNTVGDSEALIFYQKMKGDYYRYIAEFAVGEKYYKATDNALQAYCIANETAQ